MRHFAVCLIVALAACGQTRIELSADRETIAAGGTDFAVLKARVFIGGSLASKPARVSFDTTAGSFDASGSLSTVDLATDGSGTATAKLYSAATAGAATVNATYTDDAAGVTATASLTLRFGTGGEGSLPVDGTLRLSCNAVNIGALREPQPELAVRCELTGQTRAGKTLTTAAFDPTFLVEAGSISMQSDGAGQVLVYTARGGAPAPRDVAPDSKLNEPSYIDAAGKTRNPRDGLVTIVAVVDGEEAFTDQNGNGKWDPGEPFVDAPEPFIDTDDDETRGPEEKFLDLDGNGRWDAANGRWDGKTKIMAVYKLLWTGKLDNSSKTSRIERASSSIANGGKLELLARVLDANLNPVAAFSGSADLIEWTLSTSGDATTHDNLTPPLDNTLGFSFDRSPTGERRRWRIQAGSFAPPRIALTVEDGNPKDTSGATSFTVSAQITASPGPTTDGSYLPQLIEPITDKVQGVCD